VNQKFSAFEDADMDRIRFGLRPIRAEFKAAYRQFLLWGLLAVIFASGLVYFLPIIPFLFRVLLWLILAGSGTAVAYRRLGAVSKRAQAIVQPLVLEPFGLEYRGNPGHRVKDSPFDLLGMLPEGERIAYHRRYESARPQSLAIQEIQVEEFQLNAQRPTRGNDIRHMRTKFLGQGMEAKIANYDGISFLLAPRRTPINSLQIDARNKYLRAPFLRTKLPESRFSNTFQVWLPEPCTNQAEFSPELADAALDVAETFSPNRVWLSVVVRPGETAIFRLATEIGSLYRDESGAMAPVDEDVIRNFHCKVARLMWSYERMMTAFKPASAQSSNDPTTGT
jgi:hypothetical protein